MAEDGSVVIRIEGDDEPFEKTLSGLGKTAETATKTVAAAFAAASAGVAAVAKSALDGYASYEQLTGGVETLFRESSGTVMAYADRAYQTAGLSANAYMETVTGFSASLLQSLDGDTAKAAQTADQAMTDMADNANKMGTSMESIQYAYQGFAKQNYTMLDNLKLGYGGTKEEMERLLADAEKLTGVHYDISSFADITEAIHVIQTELGIAGTTALEASTTIEGSIASMVAAWQNLLVGVTDENQNLDVLIQNFVESVRTAAENILPRIETILGGIGQLAAGLAPVIVQAIPGIVTQVVPGLAQAAAAMVSALVDSVVQQAPMMLDGALALLSGLSTYLGENLPALVESGLQIVSGLTASLRENAGKLIDGALSLILSLGRGLIASLPALIEYVPEIVSNIANVINDNAPKLLAAAAVLIVELVKGLIQSIPTLVASIPKIIGAIVDVWSAFNWLNLGKSAIEAVKNGVTAMLGAVKTAGKNVLDAIVNAIKSLPTTLANIGQNGVSGLANAIRNLAGSARSAMQNVVTGMLNAISGLPQKMLGIGKNIVQGIANGIKNGAAAAVNAVADLAKRVLDKAKSALGIHSPSRVMRDEVGAMLPPGVGQGVSKAMPALEQSVQANLTALSARLRDAVQAETLTVSAQLSGCSPSMLGDQTHGRNLEAPEGLIRQIVGEELSIAVGGMQYTLNELLNAVRAGQTIVVNGRVLGQTVAQELGADALTSGSTPVRW